MYCSYLSAIYQYFYYYYKNNDNILLTLPTFSKPLPALLATWWATISSTWSVPSGPRPCNLTAKVFVYNWAPATICDWGKTAASMAHQSTATEMDFNKAPTDALLPVVVTIMEPRRRYTLLYSLLLCPAPVVIPKPSLFQLSDPAIIVIIRDVRIESRVGLCVQTVLKYGNYIGYDEIRKRG